MNSHLEEVKGLERQLELLVQTLNRRREKIALEDDPGRQVKLEYEIVENEAEVQRVRKQLQDIFHLQSSSGQTLLEEKVRQLNITEPVGQIHLVNCNRETMRIRFWDEYDARDRERFQFYFVSACPTQMPPSFSERMLYEFVSEELSEQWDSIHYHRHENNRPKLEKLPLGRNLLNCQNAFRKFFSRHFAFSEQTSFEDFLQTGLPRLEFDAAALFFFVNDTEWKSELFQEYFQWLLESFSSTHADVPRFFLFFINYVTGLHNQPNNPYGQMIMEDVNGLVRKHPAAVHLSPLSPVPLSEVKTWFRNLGETNNARIDEVIDTLVQGLKDKELQQYRTNQEFNMDDLELMQEIVVRIANE